MPAARICELEGRKSWVVGRRGIAWPQGIEKLLSLIGAAKIAKQQKMPIQGAGMPRRELLYVDDLADALLLLMERYSGEEHVGAGTDLTIAKLAETIARVVGYQGRFVYDRSKPDGTPRKLVDVARLTALGWRASTSLEDGLTATYRWYAANHAAAAAS